MNIDCGSIVAEVWDRIMTLSRYGRAPLTVGWYRGQAFIHMWDYKLGAMTWREFKTRRAEIPPKHGTLTDDIFNSSTLFRMVR